MQTVLSTRQFAEVSGLRMNCLHARRAIGAMPFSVSLGRPVSYLRHHCLLQELHAHLTACGFEVAGAAQLLRQTEVAVRDSLVTGVDGAVLLVSMIDGNVNGAVVTASEAEQLRPHLEVAPGLWMLVPLAPFWGRVLDRAAAAGVDLSPETAAAA